MPAGAPAFACPLCHCVLHYDGSRTDAAGDRLADLVDSYSCPEGCGIFEHDRATRRLRAVVLYT